MANISTKYSHMSYTYPGKFVQGNVIAPLLQLSAVAVTRHAPCFHGWWPHVGKTESVPTGWRTRHVRSAGDWPGILPPEQCLAATAELTRHNGTRWTAGVLLGFPLLTPTDCAWPCRDIVLAKRHRFNNAS